MDGISFKEMRDEYIPGITDIYNYYILNSTATFHMKELASEEIKGIVYTGDPRFASFAILDGESVCGYCILSPFKKREAYDGTAEVTVYLKPGYTGKGLGKLAISFLEDAARKNDFHVLLAVICGENVQSIELFDKLGYSRCAHYTEVGRKFGRLLDVICYQKII